MTATQTRVAVPPTWYGPGRDKYGRTRHELYATVTRPGDTEARWGCQVIVTLLPKTVEGNRFMVTNWMEPAFTNGERTRLAPQCYKTRKEAHAAAEALVEARRPR